MTIPEQAIETGAQAYVRAWVFRERGNGWKHMSDQQRDHARQAMREALQCVAPYFIAELIAEQRGNET